MIFVFKKRWFRHIRPYTWIYLIYDHTVPQPYMGISHRHHFRPSGTSTGWTLTEQSRTSSRHKSSSSCRCSGVCTSRAIAYCPCPCPFPCHHSPCPYQSPSQSPCSCHNPCRIPHQSPFLLQSPSLSQS